MTKLELMHLLAIAVIHYLAKPSRVRMLTRRCGFALVDCMQSDALACLRMQTEDGAAYYLIKVRFWIIMARKQVTLIRLVDESPDETLAAQAWTL